MQQLEDLIGELSKARTDANILKIFSRFYETNPLVSQVCGYWKQKKYREMHAALLAFIKTHRNTLLLSYVPIKNRDEFGLLVGAGSVDENRGTIKTVGQLLERHSRCDKPEGKIFIRKLITRSLRLKTPLLCMYAGIDDKASCQVIMHELHAWLLSRSREEKGSMQSLLGEWHYQIGSVSLLKKLDRLFA